MAFTYDRSAQVTATLLNDLWALAKEVTIEALPPRLTDNQKNTAAIRDMTVTDGVDPGASGVTSDVSSLLRLFYARLDERSVGKPQLTAVSGEYRLSMLDTSSLAGSTNLTNIPVPTRGNFRSVPFWKNAADVRKTAPEIGTVYWTNSGDTPYLRSARDSFRAMKEDFSGWAEVRGSAYATEDFMLWLGDVTVATSDGSSNLTAGADPARQDVSQGQDPGTTTFNAPTGGTLPYSYTSALSRPDGSSAAVSGSDLGPYTWSGTADGESYVLSLTARDAFNNNAAACAAVDIAGGGGGSSNFAPAANPARQDLDSQVQPATTTFGAFTGGTEPLSYVATVSRPDGSTASVAGTGVGPYTWSDTADGEAYALSLKATDANSNEATAVAVVDIAAPGAPVNDWNRMMLGDGSWTITDPNNIGSEPGYAFTEDASTTSITIDLAQTQSTQTQSSTRNGRRWLKAITNPNDAVANITWEDCWTLQLMVIIDSRPGNTDDIYLIVGACEGTTGNYRAMQGGLLFDNGVGPEMKLNKSGDVSGYNYGSPKNENEMAYVQICHHPLQDAAGIMLSTGLADASMNQSKQFAAYSDVMSGSGSPQPVGIGFWIGCHTPSGSGTGTVTFRAYYKFDVPASGYEPTS